MANLSKITKIFVSRIIGFLVFLVILFILNILSKNIPNEIFSGVVTFLNANLLIIVIMSLFFLLADVMYYIYFPIDLLTPLFNAVGAFILVKFIFNMLSFVNTNILSGEISEILGFEYVVLIIVVIVVLAFGYIQIIKRLARQKDMQDSRDEEEESDNDNPDYEEEDFNEEEDEKPKKKVLRKIKSKRR